MNENCKLIWTSEVDVDDWDGYFLEVNPNLDRDERYVAAAEINQSYLDDERTNLNIVLEHPIIAIADMGLWYGRRPVSRDAIFRLPCVHPVPILISISNKHLPVFICIFNPDRKLNTCATHKVFGDFTSFLIFSYCCFSPKCTNPMNCQIFFRFIKEMHSQYF